MLDNSRSVLTRRTVFVTLLLVATFVGGALFAKFKPYPYPQISAKIGELKKAWQRRSVNPAAVIGAQYSKDSGDPRLKRSLDSSLLPIKIEGVRVSAAETFPKGAGGITVVGEGIVLIDRLGGLYAIKNHQVDKLEFPALPNNVDAFVRSLHTPLSAGSLRVHDILYLEAESSLVVSHEAFNVEKQLPHLAVSLIAIDSKSMKPKGEWRTVYVSDLMPAAVYAGQGGGGRLGVKDPGKLILAIGDYNQDSVMIESAKVAQDPKSSFGKIIELELATGKSRVISLGHRNPQGLFVTAAGEIYSTEHGPAGGDELNRIVDGANFGWPNVTLGTDYGTYDWPASKSAGRHDGYAMPTFAWIPSIGISNLIQVSGFHPAWDGDLLVTSLKAQSLFRIRLDGSRVVYVEALWIGQRVRDIAQMKSGSIVLWTEDAQLLTLSADQPKLQENSRGMGYFGQPELRVCMQCHHMDTTGPTHLAPSLSNVIGREIASDNFPRYSPALKEKTGIWTAERLKAFISNPEAFARGTTMPKLEISEPDIENIIALLANARRQTPTP